MTQIPVICENRFYVYEHIRADTGDVFYVGKGTGKRAHIGNRHHRSEFWQRIVAKSGGFSVRMVAENIPEDLAFLIEIEHIDKLKMMGVKLCNLTSGGDGTAGWVKTKEWREKVGNAHRGKPKSPETRAKISESVKNCGYIHSAEAREKISKTHLGHARFLGHKHTDEWKKNMSAMSLGNKSRTGQKRSEEERAKSSIALSGRIQTKLTCPHCGKVGGNIMRRYHFDNCKKLSA